MKAGMDVGTSRKAFQINLDGQKYGTFAEIGADQKWRSSRLVTKVGRKSCLQKSRKLLKSVRFFGYRTAVAA
jgi:hypothetical protein